MARLKEEGATADRNWEANHQARERRQQRLEQERDRREEAREAGAEEDIDKDRYQFMMSSVQQGADHSQMPVYTYGRRPTYEEEIYFQLALMEDEIANGQRIAGDQPRQVPLQPDSPTSPGTDRELQWLLADSTETDFRSQSAPLFSSTETTILVPKPVRCAMHADVYYDTAMASLSSSTLRTRDPHVDHSAAQIGEPVQQIPKFRSLNALHPSHLPSPKRQKKKKHVKPMGGEMLLDPDLVRLPHSFPSFDVATLWSIFCNIFVY